MPRKTRMYIPGIPAHIVQRGNNRAATFFCDEDYQQYLQVLQQGLQRYGAKLHAYCLMTNHVHLLLTPDHEDSISRVVQHVGRQYVKYINRTYKRTGTLWEGRHKGSLVDADNYLFACYRYIELNPVSAGMVSSPAEYPWSSFNANAWGKGSELITPHPLYCRLGELEVDRRFSYRELFSSALKAETIHEIRSTLTHNHAVGCDRFKGQVEQALGRKIGHKKPGRPKKEPPKQGEVMRMARKLI